MLSYSLSDFEGELSLQFRADRPGAIGITAVHRGCPKTGHAAYEKIRANLRQNSLKKITLAHDVVPHTVHGCPTDAFTKQVST